MPKKVGVSEKIMDDKKFMDKMEKEADYTHRNGKGWFSAKTVFEVINWAKTAQGLDKLTANKIEKKLKFLADFDGEGWGVDKK